MPHPVSALARAALPAAGCTGLAAVGVGIATTGRPGGYGAVLGLATSVFFVSITLLVGRVTLTADPNVMMAAAMGSFVLKLVVFYLALRVARGLGVFAHADVTVFALTAVAVAVATMVAEAIAFQRSRRPVWDPSVLSAP